MEEKSKRTEMPKKEQGRVMDVEMIRLLQKPETRFLYHSPTNTVHDRDCSLISAFSFDEVEARTELTPKYVRRKRFCPQCARMAAVRNGIRDRFRNDREQAQLCMEFFCSAGAAAEDLIDLFVRNTGSLKAISRDCMGVRFNGEKWRLTLKGAHLSLLHNNYTVDEDYRRSLVDGFHVQRRDVPFHVIARTICRYSYQYHEDRYKADAERIRNEKFRTILAITDNFAACSRKSLLFDYYVFVDTGKRIREQAKEASDRWLRITRENERNGYTVKTCRIPRWKRPDFETLMHELKDQALTESLYDYPTVCEEALPQRI